MASHYQLQKKNSNTLTCSFEVTAQNTISVKFWVGNIRKQIPPIGLLSFTRAKVLCFLKKNSEMTVSAFLTL